MERAAEMANEWPQSEYDGHEQNGGEPFPRRENEFNLG
jgi:hypothetical protein